MVEIYVYVLLTYFSIEELYMACNNYILSKFGMVSIWGYNKREIFSVKPRTRCFRKYVCVLPHLFCTQFYEINTVFISILERRKIRQRGEVTCPISHSSVGPGVEHMHSDSKTQTWPLLRKCRRWLFAQGHTNSVGFWWLTAARWSPGFSSSLSSVWLWHHSQVTSTVWVTECALLNDSSE